MFRFICSMLYLFSTLSINLAQAGEDDLYDFLWLDPDKSVYVLQNKTFPKKERFFLDIGYVSSSSSVFQDTSGAQLKAGYFFTENWGIELGYTQYTSLNNGNFDGVKFTSGTVPFVVSPTESLSIYATWSPFYGKINTFNKIYYFDWSFSLGTGQYKLKSNLDTVIDSSAKNRFKEESRVPVLLKTAFKFHINRTMYIGAEYININYTLGTPQSPSSEKWRQSSDLILNLGMSF